MNRKVVPAMSEKAAKAERKKADEAARVENTNFVITITVMKDGGFEMIVPKGASVILAQDVLMRAQTQVWNTLLQNMAKTAAAAGERKIMRPMPGIPEGLLRRPQG